MLYGLVYFVKFSMATAFYCDLHSENNKNTFLLDIVDHVYKIYKNNFFKGGFFFYVLHKYDKKNHMAESWARPYLHNRVILHEQVQYYVN